MSCSERDPLRQTGLFILVSYIRHIELKAVDIPIDIEFLILKNMDIDILFQWQIYFIHTMIKLQQYKIANTALTAIRKIILLHGCPEHDITSEMIRPNNMHNSRKENLFINLSLTVPTIRKHEDTLRGKLWKLLIGLGCINSNKYQHQIRKGEVNVNLYYTKIRGDTKRTFLTNQTYNSRVSETRVVRVLNSYVHQTGKPYVQAGDTISGVLLYIMPELDAYESYVLLMTKYLPTYFYCESSEHTLIGSYAASYLAYDILKICDDELFQHLQPLPPLSYFFPLMASFQTICQPFSEIPKLWDFLFCFGFHLTPVMAAAHVITNKKELLLQTAPRLLQGLLSQRKWMNGTTNAKEIINNSMKIITVLKQLQNRKLWNNILHHSTDLNVAITIKNEHTKINEKKLLSIDKQEQKNEQIIDEKNSNNSILKCSQDTSVDDLLTMNNINNNSNTDIDLEAPTSVKTNGNMYSDDKVKEIINDQESICEQQQNIEAKYELSLSESSDNNCNESNESTTDNAEISDSSSSSGNNSTESTTDDMESSSTTWGSAHTDDFDVSTHESTERHLTTTRRYRNLNEFELKDEEIEMFDLCQEAHNLNISEYHVGFKFVDLDSMSEEIIKYWTKYSKDMQ